MNPATSELPEALAWPGTAPVSEPADSPRHHDFALRRETAHLGMWVFIASEVLFFGGLFVAYLYGRTHWPAGFAAASRHTHVVLGTLNTAVLLTSSTAVAIAVVLGERERRKWIAPLLWATVALGCTFLVVKGIEYGQEWREGVFPGPGFHLGTDTGPAPVGAELFFMLYFVMTGLHSAHLLIGVVILALFAANVGRARSWVQPPRLAIAGLYWHFVDVVWIFLYPLLYLVERHS